MATRSTVRAALATVEAADAAASLDDLPGLLWPALVNLVGADSDLADLTSRQQQVLRLVARGLTDAAIGHHLGCSPSTVDKHLEHIYRRLGVSCRTGAIAAVGTALANPQGSSNADRADGHGGGHQTDDLESAPPLVKG